jgi:hypothetical protein
VPPKTVVCSICNQEVLKAQTLALKDGTRACRSHPETQEQATDLKEQEQKRLQNKKVSPPPAPPWMTQTRRDNVPSLEESALWAVHSHTHCWGCDKEGMSMQEFYMQSLIALKRLQIRGEFDFLNFPGQLRTLMPEANPLATVKISDEEVRQYAPRLKDKKMRQLIPVIRVLQLCPTCLDRFGLRQRFEDSLPKPTTEQLMGMIAVMEVSGLNNELAKLAEEKEKQS